MVVDTSTEAQAASSSTIAPTLVPATENANVKRTKQDFFASIEEEQHNMFNPQTGRCVVPVSCLTISLLRTALKSVDELLPPTSCCQPILSRANDRDGCL
jgi:hypothetical protein